VNKAMVGRWFCIDDELRIAKAPPGLLIAHRASLCKNGATSEPWLQQAVVQPRSGNEEHQIEDIVDVDSSEPPLQQVDQQPSREEEEQLDAEHAADVVSSEGPCCDCDEEDGEVEMMRGYVVDQNEDAPDEDVIAERTSKRPRIVE